MEQLIQFNIIIHLNNNIMKKTLLTLAAMMTFAVTYAEELISPTWTKTLETVTKAEELSGV